MPLDIRNAQTTLETLLRDAILLALGKRLPAVATVTALRAVPTRGASGSAMDGDELINIVVSDLVTAAYRWSQFSTTADDGAAVVRPNDVGAGVAGRWLRWTSPLRLAPVVDGNSAALNELLDGPLLRVMVLDKDTDEDELTNFLSGKAPAVAIDARGDDPSAMDSNTGHRWDATYDFTTYVVSENLRGQRQAAQGSPLTGDAADPGANAIDGLIWALLGGTQLFSVCDGIRDVQVGRGQNWKSSLAQGRVIRSREYTVLATVTYPPAPNDAGPVEELDAQFVETDLHAQSTAPQPDTYVVDDGGLVVALGVGLSKTVAAGSAYIDGALVTYAGELHTFDAESDTYRDLNPDGTMTFQAVTPGGDEPPLAAGAMRVGVTTTDDSNVNDDTFLAMTAGDYGNPIQIPLD